MTTSRTATPWPAKTQIAIAADLYTHVNRSLGKAAAEQIACALRPTSPAVPSAFLTGLRPSPTSRAIVAWVWGAGRRD